MTTGPSRIFVRLLIAAFSLLAACVSHQYEPDPSTVTMSIDCDIVNGSFDVDSADDGKLLAEALFSEEDVVTSLTIMKADARVSFRGVTAGGLALPPAHFARFSCADSVLKIVVEDQYSADGVFTQASDRILELYATGEATLDLRFTSTTLSFVFIVPFYGSSDRLLRLQRRGVAVQ